MEIISIKKKKNGEYQIILSDKTILVFFAETIIKYNLLANKKIAHQKWQEIVNFNNDYKAYYDAIKYLKLKMRTKKEIALKLEKSGYLKSTIDKVINKLEKQKYINDEQYIKSFITDQINLTLNGPQKIKHALQKLGFNNNLIMQFLDVYSESLWLDRIKKISTKKIKANHNLSQNNLKNKLKTNLINLGYNQELISKIINTLELPKDSTILQKEYQKELKKLGRKFTGNELKTKIKYNLYKKGFGLSEIERTINNE